MPDGGASHDISHRVADASPSRRADGATTAPPRPGDREGGRPDEGESGRAAGGAYGGRAGGNAQGGAGGEPDEARTEAKQGDTIAGRGRRVVGRLDRHQRLAGLGAALIAFSELLPWYTLELRDRGTTLSITQSGLRAASFVELALLLVAAAVVALLVWRAEGRPLHLPASDGTLLAAAGAWSTVLIVIRMLGRPNVTIGDARPELGLDWGLGVALGAALLLAVAGLRERSRERARAAPRPTR